ncbi:hypothetical protein CEXT_730111 [Caerostris extrusa]|uniref:Uncharacterized protein n=1 Tax=Caerostris extrusa TaxID=172846 RepID=A0AAV4NA59_CAEEX|nr:hypothetical protein CEXT_730111 [Caerostris extrusa]
MLVGGKHSSLPILKKTETGPLLLTSPERFVYFLGEEKRNWEGLGVAANKRTKSVIGHVIDCYADSGVRLRVLNIKKFERKVFVGMENNKARFGWDGDGDGRFWKINPGFFSVSD